MSPHRLKLIKPSFADISSFQRKVYKVTAKIPLGRISTYQLVALAIGKPGAERAVGNALNKNPYAPTIPCHRIVRSNGEVGGFANGIKKKIALLRKEGVVVNDGRIDLCKYAYKFKK